MPEETDCVSMRVRMGDNELEVSGPRAFVEAKIDEFVKKQKELPSKGESITPSAPSRTGDVSATDKGISIGEFIRRLGLKKHTDLVLAFGYFLEKYAGETEFSPADINRCYYDAKMDTSNTSQMIIQNIKRGYIMEAKSANSKGKGKKSYTLTNTGEQFIANFLAGQI
jgi:predicted transcriptional regulator